MKQKKNNEGKLIPAIGIRVDFINSKTIDLEYVTFTPCDISNNPELSKKSQSLRERLIDILKDEPSTIKELHEILGNSEGTIRAELNRHKSFFVKSKEGDEWGLLSVA